MSTLTAMASLRSTAVALVVLVGIPSLAGAQQPSPKDGDVLVYYCHNLSMLTVRVRPKGVEVTTADRTVELAENSPPSPVRFSAGGVMLSGLGELIRFEDPGAVLWCRIEPVEVPWQEAKLRGVDFRAAGDPPWTLEIKNGRAAEFTSGQGSARIVIAFPAASLAAKGETMTMSTASGSHSLSLLAERRLCHYAGSTMTLSVTVTLDGRAYKGCGRVLGSETLNPK